MIRSRPTELFFSTSAGRSSPQLALISLETVQDPRAKSTGEWILSAYVELLDQLISVSPLGVRLRRGLAAGVDGLNKAGLLPEQVDELGFKYAQSVQQRAPELIVFTGNKNHPFDASPSVPEGELVLIEDQGEFQLRDESWEDPAAVKETVPWGWSTRDTKGNNQSLYLSGAFLVWPMLLQKECMLSDETPKLRTMLKVTLYHELIHLIRAKFYGSNDNTAPDKVDRHGTGHGPGGRLGEEVAFGGVIDAILAEKTEGRVKRMSVRIFCEGEHHKLFPLDERQILGLFAYDTAEPPVSLASLYLRDSFTASTASRHKSAHTHTFVGPQPPRHAARAAWSSYLPPPIIDPDAEQRAFRKGGCMTFWTGV